jgi:hypothetical protein
MAFELGWTESRRGQELAEVNDAFPTHAGCASGLCYTVAEQLPSPSGGGGEERALA